MCMISMVGDQWSDRFKQLPQVGQLPGTSQWTITNAGVSQADFDKLKAEVEQMKAALIKAKLYDEANGQKDCAMEEKVALLRKIAELVGISLDDVLPAATTPKVTKDE